MVPKMFFLALLAVTATALDVSEKEAEHILTDIGYYNPFGFDGSANLTNALVDYQLFYQLPVTGKLDSTTAAMMVKPRCGMPNRAQPGNAYFKTWWTKWPSKHVTYRWLDYSPDLTRDVQRATIKRAFDMWASVSGLTFSEVTYRANINIGFRRGPHGDGGKFSGPGGVLAHAFFPRNGNLHFDENERWVVKRRGTDLFEIGLHEIGHALGIEHTNVRGAVMFPTYFGYRAGLQLKQDDIAAIQHLYGRNTGGTVNPRPNTPRPGGSCPYSQDKNKACYFWATHGYCTSTNRDSKQTMDEQCCNNCKQRGVCDNKNKNCGYWANTNECVKNKDWMRDNCSKACGHCSY